MAWSAALLDRVDDDLPGAGPPSRALRFRGLDHVRGVAPGIGLDLFQEQVAPHRPSGRARSSLAFGEQLFGAGGRFRARLGATAPASRAQARARASRSPAVGERVVGGDANGRGGDFLLPVARLLLGSGDQRVRLLTRFELGS
jgi:hypothetical protein